MSERRDHPSAEDGRTETPFGRAFQTYPEAENEADWLTAKTAASYVVAQNFGNRLFAVVEGRLADEYVTRYHAAIRYQTDPVTPGPGQAAGHRQRQDEDAGPQRGAMEL